MEKNIVLRVGVYNNFNFTDAEFDSLADIVAGTNYIPFVNSNSFVTIKDDLPSIITVNPYLTSFVEPRGQLDNIKACRIKVGSTNSETWKEAVRVSMAWCAKNCIPCLFTFQRFVSRKSAEQFGALMEDYSFKGSYYRLTTEAKTAIIADLYKIAEAGDIPADLIHFCDLAEEGCPTCCNCARLVTGDPTLPVESLSLSCSGDNGECIFHCPDCWAKRIGRICSFSYDVVTKNRKQRGK